MPALELNEEIRSGDNHIGAYFPLELEHQIFEIAALKDSQDAYRLLFVAKRVHEWWAAQLPVSTLLKGDCA